MSLLEIECQGLKLNLVFTAFTFN
uniref:Uncharacterized protein n=1 Tax=Anguilla anguilla TaxID=7936 RepID=A0A0E9VFZ9_ANGAN